VLRGVWVKPSLLSEGVNQHDQNGKKPRSSLPTVQIGMQERRSVIVAITNIATSDECWAASACGKPHLTLDRYKRIAELINQAIKLNPKPDYLIFPELSLPRKWINSIARKLMDNRISLIAGAEYHHQAGKVSSEACMELLDDRLGYPSSVRIIQPKLEPAVKEDEELTIKFGLNWVHYRNKRKPVYKHNGFHFGIMVCSELQNSKARIRFQGLVDALIILSWNKDLDTFSALVEAAALDVHAYTILVNNRRYGDSRVRSPDKESFRRDVARLRGGINDFCVAVELDIEKLRSFQSRAKRWPDENAPFKPVPEGFRISDGPFGRKMKPPK